MTQFRPCIDLHQGQVKQLIGGSLTDAGARTNFVSPHEADYFAQLYQRYNLTGGHVISLGQGNQAPAQAALAAWPGGLQYGGGVTLENAAQYLNAGASHVIVTSWLFTGGDLSWSRLQQLSQTLGKDKLVVDLSCRQQDDTWWVATNRWQTVTQTEVNAANLEKLSQYCAEFLIHSADVEGLQQGIDERLVSYLGKHSPIPCTYAGGARHLEDLHKVADLSQGRLDLTIGSALDIFGGHGITLADCVAWNRQPRRNGFPIN